METIELKVENVTLVAESRTGRLLIVDVESDLANADTGVFRDPDGLLRIGDRLMFKSAAGWCNDFHVVAHAEGRMRLLPVGSSSRDYPAGESFFGRFAFGQRQ